ncbi:6-phosphogluconate dehydrogenase [Sorangium cellulosum]|uniref:6-phosphogluconate dehydrogenase n=2 Tax=Sorangium cellulosum TaxID=56 RepID=A0A150PH98_SORCE|nr:NAD(P)-dependent oxidoreductase [Sorangium cellulosum]KYF55040.1 6-phosphogluconate dehydrogenase [Sorangium cellulosum]
MAKKIGFVGVGLMGHGMAKNLLAKGFPVTAMAHRNRKPIEDLVAQGASEAKTPRAIAEASDLVILCVTGAPQVEQVVYGEDGILGASKKGMILLDCSTSEPAMSERVAKDLAALGASYADAPLARSPKDAEAGKLNTMVGADEQTFAEVRPVLEAFCENIFYMGGVGSGARTKLIYNLITMGHAALIAEALCACAATGVDLGKFAKVVGSGGANSGIFQLIVPKILESGDFSGLNFTLANAAKDLRYYNRMVADVPLTAPMGPAVLNSLVSALNSGFSDGLVGHMVASHCKQNGVELGK